MNQEQIEYYVEKYKMKMWGSRLGVMKDWIAGIGSITKAEQAEVYKRLRWMPGAISK